MATRVLRDKKKILRKIANEVAEEKSFHILNKINILFVWRLGDLPRYDEESRQVLAQTRRLPSRERDVYGYDVEVEVFKQAWKRLGPKKQRRVIWHELNHIEIEQGENFKPNRDKDGRILIEIRSHDVVITTFNAELDKFGLSGHDVPTAVALTTALKKKKKKDNK